MPAGALADTAVKEADLSASPAIHKAIVAMKRVRVHRKRVAEKRQREKQVAIPAHLAAIAACESGGNPRAIGGGGQYRGMFQMTYASWAASGGTGDPAAASVAEQVKRAEILYAQSGAGQWPVCGA